MQPLPDAPTQSKRGPRHHQLNVKYTDDEWRDLTARAEAHCRTPVDYVRRVGLGQIPALRPGFNHRVPV